MLKKGASIYMIHWPKVSQTSLNKTPQPLMNGGPVPGRWKMPIFGACHNTFSNYFFLSW